MDNVEVSFSVNKQKLTQFRSALSALLSETVCKVKFEKTDGSERVMKCTLRSDLLPPPPESDGTKPKAERKQSMDVLPVYEIDGDKPGWKSFRLDSLKYVEVVYE